MNKKVLAILMIVSTALLSACGVLSTSATSTPVPTATTAPTATLAPTDTPQAAAQPTGLDPCQLIDTKTASTLAGATFGQGLEGTIPGGMKTCTYGSQATNIFIVDVIQAPDKATADSAEKDFLNTLQDNAQNIMGTGLTVTQIPSFADGAIYAEASITAMMGTSVNGSAFAFRKGTVFFGFSDVAIGAAGPTKAAMQAEAQTVLAKLP